jgi:pimeloyl-ACP methyl ester carboxylesterase
VTATANRLDAASAAAEDVKITAIGHSMGGCVLMLYALYCRALRRPHWLRKLVLLSPAGLHRHIGTVPRGLLLLTKQLLIRTGDAPFPRQASSLQRLAARLVQDIKRTQATSDLLSAVGAVFFGGAMHDFVFRHVSLTEYPFGGTSCKVIREGVQNMQAGEFQPYDYGRDGNLSRYGSATPPSYRLDFGLFDVPMELVAGGNDQLIPLANIEETHALINLMRPGLATMTEFENFGHLDFTLSLDDGIITHVLRHLEPTAAELRAAGRPPGGDSRTGDEQPNPAAVPAVHHAVLLGRAPAASAGGTGAGSSGAAPPGGRGGGGGGGGEVHYFDAPPSAASPTQVAHSSLAHDAFARVRDGYHGDWAAALPVWRPARECAAQYPWLNGFTKLDLVMDGLDAEAREMGL